MTRVELPGEGVELGGVTGHQHEVVAVGGEAAGEGGADTGGGSGDECGGSGHGPGRYWRVLLVR